MSTTKSVKEKNVQSLRVALRKNPVSTKQSLGLQTGLSSASITNLLKEFLDRNEVIELKNATPKGGRPARQFSYNLEYEYVLSIYIRKEHLIEEIYVSVIDLLGNPVFETSSIESVTLESIDNIVSTYIKLYPAIRYITIGIPGIIQNNIILSADLNSFSQVDFVSRYSNRYNVFVSVENDVNAIAYGYNSIHHPSSMVLIYYPDQGEPGAGIVINKEVVTGATNIAGEVKFLQHKNRSFTENICTIIDAFMYTINPEKIVLSGYQITDSIFSKIKEEYRNKTFPISLELDPNIHKYYHSGLFQKIYPKTL